MFYYTLQGNYVSQSFHKDTPSINSLSIYETKLTLSLCLPHPNHGSFNSASL